MAEHRQPQLPRSLRRPRPEAVTPGARAQPPMERLIKAYGLAVVAPVLVALALTPWRVEYGRTTAIVLILPVVAVATLGATGPGLAAAVIGGLAYDLLLAAPYNSFAIADPDEVITMVILVTVGLAVGWLAGRVVRLGAAATSRDEELRHMTDFALEATTAPSSAALIESAGRHISAVIGLERCTWMEGTDLGVSTLLLPDGSLMGPLSDLGADRAHLPAQCAMPVGVENLHLGGFRLTPRPDAIVSAEERRTAAAIGQLLAAHLAARPTV